MSELFSRVFWERAIELAVRSAAHGAILSLGADFADALTISWSTFFGFAAGAALLSLLTSLASKPVANGDSPTVVR